MADIALLPEQIEFITAKDPIIQYVGGLGAGKSFIVCIKALKNALGGRSQLMVGLTYSAARDVLLTTLIKVLDLYGLRENIHYKLNKSELNVSFKGGGKILIRSAEIGNKLRGLNISDAYIDEAAYLKDDKIFQIILGRLRECEDGQLHISTSANGFNWVYDLTLMDDVKTIKVSTFKNSFLPDQYIKNMLKQYSATFIRQELYADFVTISNGFFKSDWIRDLSTNEKLGISLATSGKVKRIRFWDFAFGSDKDSDWSAGVLLALVDGRWVIEDIVRVRQEYADLKRSIIETAKLDGTGITIGYEKAGQQKAIISDLSTIPDLRGYTVRTLTVSKYGSKMRRILPVSSQAELGNVYILDTCRNKRVFTDEVGQLSMDDSHAHDDMVDSMASAFILLNEGMNSTTGHKTNLY
jgi:predicted phage terminase large subunit-like protein